MSPNRFRQIEDLYHAAREGTPQERAALLAQADPELRREVESLLAQRTGGELLDEAAIRKALPPGIEPVKGMTGGINIYSAERGYPMGPYSAVYFYVDIEGFDSPEGIKGRWMLAGAYGPQAKTSAALKAFYGLRFDRAHRALNPPTGFFAADC